jgi:hypothetical protein
MAGVSDGAVPAPVFFLSYGHAHARAQRRTLQNVNSPVVRLFEDLSFHVGELMGSAAGEYPGYLDQAMDPGVRWRTEVLRAAGTCQVFVPLLSPRYLDSPWCAMEFDAFSRRKVNRKPTRRPTDAIGEGTAILPVLWMPMDSEQLPLVLSELQYFMPYPLPDEDIVQRYSEEGVHGLLALHDEEAYQAVVWRLARRIVQVSRNHQVESQVFTDTDGLRKSFRGDGE